MEFWGVEVKPGKPLQIKPEFSKLIHISQAAVGEVKNGKGPKKVHLRLTIDDKMYVIGTLSAEERPQILFDLVLHKEFELSHDWKDGSIYLAGYIGDDESYGEGFFYEDEDEDEDNQVDALQNGNLENVKPTTGKTALTKPKPSEKPMSKDVKQTDEDDDDSDVGEDSDDDDDSELEEDSDALEHLMYGDDSDDDDDDKDDESDDDDDQDLVSHKKRPSETAVESFLPAAKKTKLASSGKSGGKTPATNGKLKEQNPKSGGQIFSKPNNKKLNASSAPHPNTKAKHAGK